MKPEDPGPIKDKKVKEELKAKYGPVIDEGVADAATRPCEIDKEYDDAMAYDEPADPRARRPGRHARKSTRRTSKMADDWVQKALETKKIKAETKPKTGGGIADRIAK